MGGRKVMRNPVIWSGVSSATACSPRCVRWGTSSSPNSRHSVAAVTA